MDSQNSQQISVIEPIGAAIETTKAILFSPFDFAKWFTIGFCAWLSALCQGGGFNFNFNSHCGNTRNCNISPDEVQAFILNNLTLIIGIASGIFIVSIIVGAILLWLSSRGRFMFLSCVAQNKAEVKLPWHRYRQEGNSLFLFRLVVAVIGFFVFVILAGIVTGLILIFRKNGMDTTILLIGGLAALAVVALPVALLFSAFTKSTHDFVVPIMYLHRISCVQAWGRFWQLLKNNFGKFILYFLFQIVIGMAIAAITVAAMVATCCCAACIIVIPYLGTVLLLPLIVFARSYSLCYLRQYGSIYDAFTAQPQLEAISE